MKDNTNLKNSTIDSAKFEQTNQKDQNLTLLNKIYPCMLYGSGSDKDAVYPTIFNITSKHAEHSKKFKPDYILCLINESEINLASVEMCEGGFNGDDDFIELGTINNAYGPLPKGNAILLGCYDRGELDYVLWFKLILGFTDSTKIKTEFIINKGYALSDRIYRYSPVIKTSGYRFVLSEGK